MANTYATDGKCHNANHGTFGHECNKPATWLGGKPTRRLASLSWTPPSDERGMWWSGYCDHCKAHGDEARTVAEWRQLD